MSGSRVIRRDAHVAYERTFTTLPHLPLGSLTGCHGILPLACLPAEGRLKKSVCPNFSKPRSEEDRARRVRHELVIWVGEAVAGRERTKCFSGS